MSTDSDRRAYAAHQSRLSGLAMVLKAAEASDLPAPWIVTTQTSTLHVRTATDLDMWAEWLDAVTQDVEHDGTTQHYATGETFDLTVRVLWIEDHETPAPRIPAQRVGGAA